MAVKKVPSQPSPDMALTAANGLAAVSGQRLLAMPPPPPSLASAVVAHSGGTPPPKLMLPRGR